MHLVLVAVERARGALMNPHEPEVAHAQRVLASLLILAYHQILHLQVAVEMGALVHRRDALDELREEVLG